MGKKKLGVSSSQHSCPLSFFLLLPATAKKTVANSERGRRGRDGGGTASENASSVRKSDVWLFCRDKLSPLLFFPCSPLCAGGGGSYTAPPSRFFFFSSRRLAPLVQCDYYCYNHPRVTHAYVSDSSCSSSPVSALRTPIAAVVVLFFIATVGVKRQSSLTLHYDCCV